MCVIEDCGRKREGDRYGLCKSHSQKFRKTMNLADLHCTVCGNPLPFATRLKFHKECAECKHDGCAEPYFQRDFCRVHYMRFYRRGEDYAEKPRCADCGKPTGSDTHIKKFCDDCNRQRFLESHKRSQHVRRSGQRESDKFTVKDLLDLDGDLCYLCQSELGEDATYEHIIPLSKGGTNRLANVALAHRACNNKKKARLIEEIRDDFPMMRLPERIDSQYAKSA